MSQQYLIEDSNATPVTKYLALGNTHHPLEFVLGVPRRKENCVQCATDFNAPFVFPQATCVI
jgi:hypothetical protein